MKMVEQDNIMWLWSEATPDEKRLFDRFTEYCYESGLFDDMLFKKGSHTYDLIKCKSKSASSDEWIDDEAPLPESLECFMPTFFKTIISDDSVHAEYAGYYDHEKQIICLSNEYKDSDPTLLHEMIHMFESIINDEPLYFHDTLYWSLYSNLKDKIVGLDEAISQHAHLLNEWGIQRIGGLHDILFLLKSFDLDIHMGYPLGTVFGYKSVDDFKCLSYKQAGINSVMTN